MKYHLWGILKMSGRGKEIGKNFDFLCECVSVCEVDENLFCFLS